MASAGDVTVAQDGGQGNVKLHPYLFTLVRWCVSCVWSTATILLHRLMTTPPQPISGPKPVPPRAKMLRRAAGTEHLHPEPRVECQLLHHPAIHTMDVIFVHGLYGSLGNTWRQGDWRQKYVKDPKIVSLRDHSKPNACNCHENSYKNHNENKFEDTKIRKNVFTNHIDNEDKCDDNKIRKNVFTDNIDNENKCEDGNITDLNDLEMSFNKINEKLLKKVIPEENDLITEQFYNNTLQDQVEIVENYDTQANFICDMFKKETDCDKSCENNTYKERDNSNNDFECIYENDTFKYNHNDSKCDQDNDFKCNENNDFKCDGDNDFKCKYNEINDFNECKCTEDKTCEVGCGCICNNCYSSCWPRDWIKVDFPGARVISINYTSDPYLWRPLWIKENKRLNLYQRADQMIDKLLDMGVGEKPIIWVGHSKGGLFIKQIYCEAYEAYMKTNKNLRKNDETKQTFSKKQENPPETHNGITAENIDTIIGHFSHEEGNLNNCKRKNDNYSKEDHNQPRENDNYIRENDNYTTENDHYEIKKYNHMNLNNNYKRENDEFTKGNDHYKNYNNTTEKDNYKRENDNYNRENDNYTKGDNNRNIDNIVFNNACVMNETLEFENVFEQIDAKSYNKDNLDNVNVINDNISNIIIENNEEKLIESNMENDDTTSANEVCRLTRRASLWSSSRGFMFYSVPHRGSPLADIKTPVTARSVDLLEIAKDCPLVLELHSRWERAVGPVGTRGRPAVRSVVETCRTLMSVLWLRIVSTDSADAGIGTLSGISVDHREICKPTSRACLLYTMLTDLIHDATACNCQ